MEGRGWSQHVGSMAPHASGREEHVLPYVSLQSGGAVSSLPSRRPRRHRRTHRMSLSLPLPARSVHGRVHCTRVQRSDLPSGPVCVWQLLRRLPRWLHDARGRQGHQLHRCAGVDNACHLPRAFQGSPLPEPTNAEPGCPLTAAALAPSSPQSASRAMAALGAPSAASARGRPAAPPTPARGAPITRRQLLLAARRPATAQVW